MARKKPKAWEPREGETLKYWRYFLIYLHMEKRSLAKVARATGHVQTTIEKLSSKWEWRLRCKEFDAEYGARISRAIDEVRDDAIAAMKNRHIKLGLGMQSAAAKELKAWVAKIEEADREAKERAIEEGRDPEEAFHNPILRIRDLIRLADRGTSLERLNRGEPTDVQTLKTDESGVENLDVKELRYLKALKEKMRGSS